MGHPARRAPSSLHIFVSRNLKLTLAYDGTDFNGWQIQPGQPTVQGTLAECIRRMTGEDVLPQGSGRTDAGVHALGQVASFAIESPIPERGLMTALNDTLPPSIRVSAVEAVEASFHARHSAKAKTYQYRIFRGDVCPPFLARYIFHYPYPMNEEAMMRATENIVGRHDFTSFAASDPDRSARIAQTPTPPKEGGMGHPQVADGLSETVIASSNVRTIHSALWVRTPDELSFTVRGDGFLHHMVRNLVGTLLQVGKGSLRGNDITRILECRDRSAAGPTAAACGLYMVSVEY
jgi:tRNA pseudouridine38-40 synthase